VGRFLGPSISAHYRRYPLDAHVAAWRAAGLTDVEVDLMSLGGGLVMWGSKGPREGAGAAASLRAGAQDPPAAGSGS
jgi:hypothetical protein